MRKLASFILLAWFSATVCVFAAPQVDVTGRNGTSPSSTSNPVAVQIEAMPSGVAVASITNTTTDVPNTSTTVTLAAASNNVTVYTSPDAAICYVDFTGGAATTADARIDPGAGLNYTGPPTITSFKIIGASAAGKYMVFAH